MFGQIIPLIVGLISIPILMKSLGDARFGLLSLIWAVIGYFTLFDLGLGRAIVRQVASASANADNGEIVRAVWTTTAAMLAFSSIGSVILFAISPWLVNHVFEIPQELRREALHAFLLLSPCPVLIALSSGFRGVLEARMLFKSVSFLQAITGSMTFAAPLVALWLDGGLVFVTLALVSARFLALFIHFYLLVRAMPSVLKPAFSSAQERRTILNFAGWVTVSNVLSPLVTYFDRFVLGATVPVAQLIYYTTPFEIVTRLQILPTAYVRVIFPIFAGLQNLSELRELHARSLRHLFGFLFPIVLLITYCAEPALALWLGNDFAIRGAPVVQILTIGIFINSLAWLPFALLQSRGRADLTAKLHLVELPISVLATWYLILKFEVIGAALGFTLRVSLDLFFLLVAAKKILTDVSTAKSDSRFIIRDVIGLSAVPAFLLLPVFAPTTLMDELGIKIGVCLITLVLFGFYFWKVILVKAEREQILVFVKGGFNARNCSSKL